MENAPETIAKSKNLVRYKDFARRLELSCDGKSEIPPVHFGRYKWIAEQWQAKFGKSMTPEGVRKWFAGISRPRHNEMALLASLLNVDPAWLASGVNNRIEERELRLRAAVSNGVINVVAGFVQMDGGHPAFPQDDDADAEERHINLYAIIRGAKYSFTIVSAIEGTDGLEFPVPIEAKNNVILGVVRDAGTSVRIYELDWEKIDTIGVNAGGRVLVSADAAEWRLISGFSERL